MSKRKIKKLLKGYIFQLIYILTIFRFGFRDKGGLTDKKLLIIKLDAIGDYVLFRNFLQEIKSSSFYKDYQITFLGNSAVRDLAETLDKDYVDKFIWFDKKNFFKRPFRIFKVMNLIHKRFNVVIQATYSREFIGDLLVKLSGATERFGFNGDCLNISLKEKKKTDCWYTKLIDIDPKINFEFYRNRSFFSQILGKDLVIRKPWIDIKNISVFLPAALPDDFILLFPGAQQNFRKWPADNFHLISNYLIDKYARDIVICGSQSDEKSAEIINSDDNKRIFDLTGKTNLGQLIAIISRAKLVISNDTAGAHIGAALAVPTIVLSQFNHYSRFVPYPSEISERIICLLPHIFDGVSDSELIDKFKNGSDEDISLISVNDVKQTIDKFIDQRD